LRKRKYFTFEGVRQEVIFKESETLPGGTEVDIYEFAGDPTKDLAIYKTKKTPLQRVEGGERTVEGYISGVGKLRIGKPDGTYITFYVGGGNLKELIKILSLLATKSVYLPTNPGASLTWNISDYGGWQ